MTSNLKLRVLPTFPAQTIGGSGIKIGKSNGVYTVALDYASVGTVSAVSPADKPASLVALWNANLAAFQSISVASLAAASLASMPDGTAAAPGLAFASEANTGLYRSNVGNLSFATLGTVRATINATALVLQNGTALYNADGAVGAPSLTFGSESATGFFRAGAGTLGLSVTGATIANWTNAGLFMGANCAIFSQSGSAAAPTYTFAGDSGTGMYRSGGGNIDFASGAARVLTINAANGLIIQGAGLGVYTNTLAIKDAINPSNYLAVKWNEDSAADRTFNLLVNGADRTLSLSGNLTVASAAAVSGTNTGDQTITLTGDVAGSGTGSFAATIAGNAVSNAKFRQGAALSVVGVAGNAAANVADIATAADGDVLRRSGTTLGFGKITHTASISDYEEGSWTPTLEGSTTAGTQTYAVQLGRYIRTGNKVTVIGFIVLSAKDGATAGNIQIGGLPYATRNLTNLNPCLTIGFTNNLDVKTAGGFTSVCGFASLNSTNILLYETGDNVNAAALPVARFGASSAIPFSMTYFIN
jgi:hypothetical protein